MVSRENRLIAAFAVAALAVAYGVAQPAGLPSSAQLAALIAAGVVAPTIVNDRLDRRSAD